MKSLMNGLPGISVNWGFPRIIALGLLAVVMSSGIGMSASQAAQFTEDDQYVVHYSAIPSTFITAETAKQYDLIRSRQRGLLNISVQRKQPDGSTRPVTATLKGHTAELGPTRSPLEFQLVTEGKAIYYLAPFRIRDGATLTFTVDVEPVPEHQLKVRFSQPFYEE